MCVHMVTTEGACGGFLKRCSGRKARVEIVPTTETIEGSDSGVRSHVWRQIAASHIPC